MYGRTIFLFVLMMLLVSGAATVNAQQDPSTQQSPPGQQNIPDIDVNDDELENFVKAVDKVNQLQQKSEGEMIEAVRDEGLEPNRFVEINNIQQNQGADTEATVSEKELESFNNAMKKVQSIQQDVQKEQVKAIEGEGLNVERYVQIARAVQQDPELMKKVEEIQQD